jgi:hypothetical protein
MNGSITDLSAYISKSHGLGPVRIDNFIEVNLINICFSERKLTSGHL